jgi:hypothetical protein
MEVEIRRKPPEEGQKTNIWDKSRRIRGRRAIRK